VRTPHRNNIDFSASKSIPIMGRTARENPL
jgi:hypothetical protein